MTHINMISANGNSKIEANSVAYKPRAIDPKLVDISRISDDIPFKGFEVDVIKTNLTLNDGSIELDFDSSQRGSRFQVVFNGDSDIPAIYIGLNVLGCAYGIAKWESNTLNFITAEGRFSRIPDGVIHIKIAKSGSTVSLYVNGVVVAAGNAKFNNAPLAFVFHSDADVNITNISVSKEKPKIFVVMQFTQNYNELYKEVITKTCESLGLECVRADEFSTNTLIIDDVVNSIKNSSAIIAEITPDNPNVFWEVGYAHGINKPVILVCDREREKLPFDLAGLRTLFYDNKIAGKTAIEIQLKKHLEQIFRLNSDSI